MLLSWTIFVVSTNLTTILNHTSEFGFNEIVDTLGKQSWIFFCFYFKIRHQYIKYYILSYLTQG
jgi:hypothetical protein